MNCKFETYLIIVSASALTTQTRLKIYINIIPFKIVYSINTAVEHYQINRK